MACLGHNWKLLNQAGAGIEEKDWGRHKLAPVRLEDSDGDRAPSILFAQPVDSPRIGLLRPELDAKIYDSLCHTSFFNSSLKWNRTAIMLSQDSYSFRHISYGLVDYLDGDFIPFLLSGAVQIRWISNQPLTLQSLLYYPPNQLKGLRSGNS